ncbi:MAG: biotin/lipoyl-binding protein [Bryobacterales bacterium]|nr:biotin/lipoyl-binding protein [Bryobacterales bacterium]
MARWCSSGAAAYWAGRRSAGVAVAPGSPAPTPAQPADSARVLLTGTVRAADPVNIHPDTSGILQSLHVRRGDTVKEGDLLAIVRNDAFDAIEQRLSREHQSLTMRVESLEKSLAQARIDLARVRSEAESSRSKIEGARIEAERQKALFDAGATSRLSYERAQQEWESVRRQSAAVDQILSAAETRVSIEERNLSAEKLALEDKRAEWESARGDVQLGEVLAAVEGVVVEVQTEAGVAVSPNGEPLLVIAPVESTRFAVVQPSEIQMRRIRVGQSAVLRPQTVSDVREIPGAVSAFRGSEVLVEFEDFDNKLPPGTSVQVEIDTTGGAVARVLPAQPFRFATISSAKRGT